MNFAEKKFGITSKLLDFHRSGATYCIDNYCSGTATCEIQLTEEIPEHAPPNGIPVALVPPCGFLKCSPNPNILGAAKHLLNNPGKYFISRKGFYVEPPQDMDDIAKIYDWERGAQAPSSEQVLTDPLLYINDKERTTAKLARTAMLGDISIYLK